MVHRSAAVTTAGALQADRVQREVIEKMQDEFISVVSHELRTPLTSLRGSLGLLRAGLLGPIPPKAGPMMDLSLSNTDRLIRVINDVLDIGRFASGRVMMEVRPTNARDLVLRSIESLKLLLHSAQLNIVDHAEPIELIADGDRIVQTLTNLISNAIKFSPPGAAIGVSAARVNVESSQAPRSYSAGCERLVMRRDSGTNPDPYVAGTLLAVRHVAHRPGVRRRLDSLRSSKPTRARSSSASI